MRRLNTVIGQHISGQARSHRGLYGRLGPQNQNSPPKFHSFQIPCSNRYASTLPVVLQIEALKCTQMREESADFFKIFWGRTILAPLKSSIASSKFWTWLRARLADRQPADVTLPRNRQAGRNLCLAPHPSKTRATSSRCILRAISRALHQLMCILRAIVSTSSPIAVINPLKRIRTVVSALNVCARKIM